MDIHEYGRCIHALVIGKSEKNWWRRLFGVMQHNYKERASKGGIHFFFAGCGSSTAIDFDLQPTCGEKQFYLSWSIWYAVCTPFGSPLSSDGPVHWTEEQLLISLGKLRRQWKALCVGYFKCTLFQFLVACCWWEKFLDGILTVKLAISSAWVFIKWRWLDGEECVLCEN